MSLLLQHKILVGYFLLMAIIGSMVATILHERNRVQEIEKESVTIYQTQCNINVAHRYITILATYGESAISWNEEDYVIYQERRLRTDSLLQVLQEQCKDIVFPEQIDTLRMLLANKEEHLFRILKTFRQQDKADSLLLNRLPAVTAKARRQANPAPLPAKRKALPDSSELKRPYNFHLQQLRSIR